MIRRLTVLCVLCASANHGLAADRDEPLDLPAACLVAGGITDPVELARSRQRLDAACQSIADPALPRLPVEDRARVLLARLHARVLTGRYDRQATDWRVTLDRGDFNCLSAAVLYHELCRQTGVPLELWAEPGHVHCRLGSLRIEPTSRDWPARRDTGSPAARQLTPSQFVGRYWYNRGIDHVEIREFAAGVAALQTACRLDPEDADARANLLAGLNNWALALSTQNQNAAAQALIARGLAIDPENPPLVANERYLRSLVP
jgi:hypothetical protein